MITKLRLRNYRNHADTEIPLSPLTCFIGPAGGGKSNVFKALELLRRTLQTSPKEYFGAGWDDFAGVRSRWAGPDDRIEIGVDVTGFKAYESDHVAYEVEIGAGPVVTRERLVRHAGGAGAAPQVIFDTAQGIYITDKSNPGYEDSSQLRLAYSSPWDQRWNHHGNDAQEFAHAFARHLELYWPYHLQADRLRQPGRANGRAKHFFDRDSLSAFLLALRNNPKTADRFDNIESQLRELFPNLNGIAFVPAPRDELKVAFEFRGYSGVIPADDLSDGTLYTLGLLCITEQPYPPYLIAIEEPETGINPRRLKWLFERFADLAYREDGYPVQVLLSTHAPYLLDLFRDTPEAVCVMDAPEGRTRVRTLKTILAENPELPDDVSLGTQWFMGFFEGWGE
jgi:predicted ATPase